MKEYPRIVFMGTPEFAVGSLAAIVEAGYNVVGVITVPDKPAGRGKKLSESAVKKYAMGKNLPLLQPSNLKAPEFLAELKALKADLQIVVAFRMLPKAVWEMPALGTFNLHASLLPQYRGAAPINWAVINGEEETGVTTFLLNERIDEGEILLFEKVLILKDETAGQLHDKLKEVGSKLIIKTIEGLATGTLKPQKQIVSDELKPAPKIFKETCKIDWNNDGQVIVNFIRGLAPYPGAYTEFLNDENKTIQLKIFAAEFENKKNSSKIGTVETDDKTFLRVAVPNGYVKITELQPSGKKNMKIKEFFCGNALSKYQQAI